MSANNNTTSLMEDSQVGTVGTRNFSDYTAREISTAVSRRNYRNQIKSDKDMADFRDVVYRMVSGWAIEDKIAQITEYGDASQLQKYKNPSEEVINKILTESIIIHLDPADLRKLRMDAAKKTNQVRSGIAKAEKHKQTVIRKSLQGFNTKTFEKTFGMTKNARSSGEMRKIMKNKVDATYTVPKYIERQYGKLRKELKDVLKTCFNKVELTAIAFSMGIEFPKGTKDSDVYQWIINKVCLYVDLIIGRSKNNYGNAILDPEPYNNILQYTSYSYVTGKPGLDPDEWSKKKDEARRAKVAIKERSKFLKQQKKFKGNSKSMKDVTGGVGSKSVKDLAKKLKQQDVGVLADVEFEELLKLAGKYGIDPSSKANKNISILKAKIYNGMRQEAEQLSKLKKLEDKFNNRDIGGNRLRNVKDRLSIYKKSGSSDDDDDKSIDIPIVHFKASGDVVEKSILKAVPVFIVGQGLPGKKKEDTNGKSKEEIINSKLVNIRTSRGKGQLVEKSSVPQVQLDAMNYIMSLPLTLIGSGKSKIKDIPTSISEMITDLQKSPKVGSRLTDMILADAGFNSNRELANASRNNDPKFIDYKLRVVYLYAISKNYKELQDYLKSKYNIYYKPNKGRMVGQGILKGLKTTGKILAGLTSVGLAVGAGLGIKHLIGNIIKNLKMPTDKSQLSEKAASIYDEVMKWNIGELRNNIHNTGFGFNNSALDKISNDSSIPDKDKLGLLRAIYAKLISQIPLMKLFLFEAGIMDKKGKFLKYEDDFKEATKRNIFRKTAAFFKRIGRGISNIFKKQRKGIEGRKADTEFDDKTLTGEETDNSGKNLFLPKVVYKPYSGIVDENQIKEVLPVYVVNLKNMGGVDNTLYTEGIGGNVSALEKYQKSRIEAGDDDIELTKGKNHVTFTKSAKQIFEEMKELGYTPVSKNILKQKGEAGKKYTLKNEDLQWAIENNFKFASGGYTYSDSYITGDARGNNIFANGAKPELVQTFSKTPVLSKITPIKKFADGGISTSTRVKNAIGKVKEIQEELTMRAGIASSIRELGGEVPEDIQIAKPKKLAKYLEKATKNYKKEKKKRKKPSESKSRTILSSDAERLGIKEVDTNQSTIPVYVVNEFANGKDLFKHLSRISSTISSNFSTLMTGLGSGFQLAAPMGVGMGIFSGLLGTGIANTAAGIASDVITSAAESLADQFHTGGSIRKMATGGKVPRFATGGAMQSIITGDAASSNIFANGAKPELVSSDGNMDIIPLNKTGTENQNKVTRMTPEERRNALATAISSHIIKFNYNLPDGTEEVSNQGEAIKVYDVKPGINDKVDVNGSEISLLEMLAGITAQLTALVGTSTSGNQLLTAIASKPTGNTTVSGGVNNPNPFAGGFPETMNSILGGN